ncbi:MAG: sigma-54-dependent Fis family transcriptional regulator [Betaproteobacteria bacterium]|nr:sigma-54-dependent Fis family transcriptional regulator [Betaproteobacteria bacterium]
MAGENPYFGFKKDRAKTYSLWERFNAGLVSAEELADPHERLLIEDWRHCAELGIDVAMKIGLRLSDEEFRALLEDNQQLLDKARPAIDRVSTCLFDVPGILILADGTGAILHVAGDREVRRLAAERSGIVEGSRWLESVAGSNGVGSAISRREPVHVYSAEHYCEGWHSWTCAATPIFGPDGDELFGVIDFTTIDKDYRDQALGLSYSLANAIQANLRLDFQLERNYLIQRFQEYLSRYPTESLVVVDRRGQPVRHSSTKAAKQFAEQNAFERMAEGGTRETVPIVMPGTERLIGTVYIVGVSTGRVSLRVASATEPVCKGDFVTANAETVRALKFVEKAAASDANVLISGETGTGKELIARYIHGRSARARGPYLPVNCGALSKELMTSSFFGYVGGAFTGADPKGRKGFFEAANGGTLFLDEIGELPLEIQAALLRVLEDGTYQRVGTDRPSNTDCRIVAATNRDLQTEIAKGGFRSDLFYRLNVVRITVPPLRERPEDIRLLARRFAEKFCSKHGIALLPLASEAEDRLMSYAWPGNVRELRNVIEAAIICAEGQVTVDDLPPDIRSGANPPKAPEIGEAGAAPESAMESAAEQLRDYERKVILAALDKYRKVSRVARELGMSRSTLYRKFEALGIDQRQFL